MPKTASEQLQELYALGPKAETFMRSRNIGSKKNPQIINELDNDAYTKAQKQFQADHAEEIKDLRTRAGQETTKSGLETEDAQARAGYLRGPTHQAFSDWAAAPPAGGALLGYGLARSTIPRAPVGAGPTARLLGMAGPAAEALLGPGVDQIARWTQGNNPTERGKDITAAVGNAGWGEALGAGVGGVQQMMLTAPETYRDWQKRRRESTAAVKKALNASNNPPTPSPYSGLVPTEASGKFLIDLGGTDTGKLGENLKSLPQAIRGAPEGALRKVAADWPGVDAAEPDVNALRNALEASAKKTLSTRRRLASIAPWLSPIGAATGLLGADAARSGADAAGLGSSPTAKALAPIAGGAAGYGAGYGLEKLAGKGLNVLSEASPLAARAISVGAKALPVIGSALLAKDVYSGMKDRWIGPDGKPIAAIQPSPNPFEGEDAAFQKREADRENLAKRIANGEAAQVSPSVDTGRQSDKNYGLEHFDDLPDHEKTLLSQGLHPRDIAQHALESAALNRAGNEAKRRGEDFEGGTDQYERERRALQTLYRAANIDAAAATAPKPKAKASPGSAPALPPSPPLPSPITDKSIDDAAPMYAMGGTVHNILRRYH